MTLMNHAKHVPGALSRAYFTALRLPLHLAERAAGQAGNDQWPPSMAVEGLQAKVESIVGAITRDESLSRSADLRYAKLAKLRDAAVLETEAELTRERAADKLEQRREDAARRRSAAAQQAEKQKAAAQRRAEQRKQEASRKAADKVAASRAAKVKGDEVIERQERAAKLQVLANEEQALEREKEALDAEAAVERIDEAIDASRESRAAGS